MMYHQHVAIDSLPSTIHNTLEPAKSFDTRNIDDIHTSIFYIIYKYLFK